MSAEQRQMFEETLAEDQASLEAQLQALQGELPPSAPPEGGKRRPRRQALPEHLRHVGQRHEPENTTCACGEPMTRIGEDVSERLDIVPAEFFVHRHIRGKWACKCCQVLVQEPVEPQIIDKPVLRYRRGAADIGTARAHPGQPLRGPTAVLPAGADQRARACTRRARRWRRGRVQPARA